MADQGVAKTVIESGITAIVLTTLLGLAIRKVFGGVWDTLKNSASKTDLTSLRVSVNSDIKEIKQSITDQAEKHTEQYIELIKAIATLKK